MREEGVVFGVGVWTGVGRVGGEVYEGDVGRLVKAALDMPSKRIYMSRI